MNKTLTIISPLLAAAAAFTGVTTAARRADAKLKVVTTIQTFKVMTEEIGGDKVEVTALVGEAVDPHHVDAKPSYALTLNKADLLVHVGLDLEVGWLPPLLEQSRNPAIQSGKNGNLDASTAGISVRDTGGSTSRAEGDIHPLGNPHYWLPPDNALAVARAITDRLKALDESNASAYEKGYEKLAKKVEDRKKEWSELAAGLKGVKVVTYHKSWSYLTNWLGISEIGYIEPKPGVPPDSAHLAQLVRDAKKQGARCVIVESFYPRNTAQRVAELGDMKLAVLPSDAGGALRTYADLVDYVVAQLSTNCAAK
jgi:zinc/manganese transport system substrate-binding protein